ncbi:MAG: hypothetical protein JWM68_3552 [Verrucomicrobiales bacterium]|nr:hypothetical protein [Verrucomicrobiales bacterium]
MHTTTEESVIVQKTKELCEAILAQPEAQNIRNRISKFMADDKARTQFDALNEKGDFLHHKQHQGVKLSDAEVADFEKDREALLENATIRNFLEAQREMQKITENVSTYVGKAFELGRVPADEDLKEKDEDGSCGHGCGCH